jgi:hypothetical protein
MGAGGGGCGRTSSGAACEVDVVGSGCVVLWSLKQGIEQLVGISRGVEEWWEKGTDYGSAQVGHLYFLGSEAQTPQRGSDMVRGKLRICYNFKEGFFGLRNETSVATSNVEHDVLRMERKDPSSRSTVPKRKIPAANFDADMLTPSIIPPELTLDIHRNQPQCLSHCPCDVNRYGPLSPGHAHRVHDRLREYRAPAMLHSLPHDDGSPPRKRRSKVMCPEWTRCM